ncbi:MinD/ParA family protein [Candidatus Woesearchaeota archaeon]|nr:MinD/ParA family protein [Candidatus Woesearchaeota archaeon]MBW3018242.1 MinD/ParA family protein [Candidatus Woesearchaeota archaeon]
MTRFIGVASGKGGVGRTTIAINLATALSQFGREVILIDAHLSSPHIALHLGAPNVPKTIHHALRKTVHVKDAAYQHPSGLKLIPGSIRPEHQEDVPHKKFKDILLDLIGTCEVVIIDMGPSGDEVLSVMRATDDLLIIATPDLPSATEALKTIRKAKELGKNVLGIVLNRVRGDSTELSIENVETITDTRVIGVIQEDHDIREALKQKQPVVYSHPDSKVSIQIRKLAANLIGQEYSPGKRR